MRGIAVSDDAGGCGARLRSLRVDVLDLRHEAIRVTIETIVAFDCNKLSAALLFFEADVLKVAASSVLEKMVLNAEIAELRQMLQRGHERTVVLPSVGARHAKFTLPNW